MSNNIGKSIIAKNGMVSSGRIEASKIGVEILKSGGNAVDAAVATGLALGLCEPSTSGLGGGGFMIIHLPNMEKGVMIDFRETASENASPDMYESDRVEGKPLKAHKIGGKACAVPGEIMGFEYALQKYGTMKLSEVIEPVKKLAEDGFEITEMMKTHFGDVRESIEARKDSWETYKDVYLKNVGDKFKNPNFARTLGIIAEKGVREFYEGEIAEKIVNSALKDGGVITLDDLKNYKVEEIDVVSGNVMGYDIESSAPPSSGGTHIIQALNILENSNIKDLNVNSPEYLDLMYKVLHIVYRDRAKFMADKNFVPVPVKGLTNKEYAVKRYNDILENKFEDENTEDPWDYEHDETTHYSVLDCNGGIVSVTKTINLFCGSCLVAGDTGILLNNTMADFSLKADNINCIMPGKKSLSSMSPTILSKDGKCVCALGTPGGSRIIATMIQVLAKMIWHDFTLEDAIASPRVAQGIGNTFYIEGGIPVENTDILTKYERKLEFFSENNTKFGGFHGIFITEKGVEGTADPRRDGMVVSFR